MADTRLPDTVLGDPQLDDLSDAAFRLWTLAYVYSNKHGTDGHIPEIALRYLHPDGVRRDLVDDLELRSLLITDRRGGWSIVGFLNTQTSAAQVTKYKEDNAKRQAEWRKRQADTRENQAPEPPPGDASPNALPNDLRRQGKGKGQNRPLEEDLSTSIQVSDLDRESWSDEQKLAHVFQSGVVS